MTYKEYITKTNPEKVSSAYFGGVKSCPGNYVKGAPICDKCDYSPDPYNCGVYWNQKMPEEKKEEPVIDINKIIDDAMEKKDRTVSIYIGRGGVVSINVQPYEMEVPHWINHDTDILRTMYECSACGHANDWLANYCPHCGEQMKIIRDQKEEETDGQI